MKKFWKILAVAALALLTAVAFWGCENGRSKTQAETDNVIVVWNVDASIHRGSPQHGPRRQLSEDGYYYVQFAYGGQQQRLKVAKDVYDKGLDMQDVVCLQVDGDGVVTDFYKIEDYFGGYFAESFFVESIDGTTVTCNSAASFKGYRVSFELTEDVEVYLGGASSPLVGMPSEIHVDDEITVVCDKNQKVTHAWVVPMKDVPDVYWNITRMYNSTTKMTTRESDETGTYVFDMVVNGTPVTVKTKDIKIASAIDKPSTKNVALGFDEDGYVNKVSSGASAVGSYLASWCHVTDINDRDLEFTRIRTGSNQGTIYTGTMSRDCKVYDVSGEGQTMGEITEPRLGDLVYCLTDARKQIRIIFVIERKVDSPLYWNVERKYSSAKKDTTRYPDRDGWYYIIVAANGEQQVVRTKDRSLVKSMDSKSVKHFGLKLDGDVVTKVYSASTCTGGNYIASWYDVTKIDEDGTVTAQRKLDGTTKGKVVTVKMAEGCEVYNVSKIGGFVGQKTTLRVTDRIHGQCNADGELVVVFVVNRLANSPLYWNVNRQYDSTNKVTKRVPDEDGYYWFTLAANGEQKEYKTKDKDIATAIDSKSTKHCGLALSGNTILKVYTAAQVTGGTYFASWYDVTELTPTKVTAKRILSGSTQGKVVSAPIAPNCQIYDVSPYADLVGEKTTLEVGDRIHGQMNVDGQLVVIYVVDNRTVKGADLYWNVNRMYDSTNKVSTRQPDEDGWYEILLACNGKQLVAKTQDPEIVRKMDAKTDYYFGLKVDENNVITNYYSQTAVTGGSYFASWYDVTEITEDGTVHTLRTLSGSNHGNTASAKMAEGCRVFNVSDNYMEFEGEETTLRVGDRIQGQRNKQGELVTIYVVNRPDIPGEPDHFHCTCGSTAAEGMGSHTCDETIGWSAWTNTRRLPSSGNWYLTVDVQLEASVSASAGKDLRLCLNGHTISAAQNGSSYVFNVYGNLAITDCSKPENWGSVIGRNNTYGSIMYVYDTSGPATVDLFAGNFYSTVENKTKSGGLIYAGSKGDYVATVNIYGGNLTGVNMPDANGAIAYVIESSCVNVYGGTLTGGTAKNGGIISMASTASVNLLGGTLTGGTAQKGGAVYGYGSVTVGGNVQIQGNKDTDGQPNNIYLTSGKVLTVQDLAETAKMGITMASSGLFAYTDKDLSANFVPDDGELTMNYDAEKGGMILFFELPPHDAHCVCVGKAAGVGGHTSCSAITEWIPWGDDKAEKSTLPTESGNYYLVSDVTMSSYVSTQVGTEVTICLNGYNIHQPGNSSIYSAVRGVLNITDCSEHESGSITTVTNGYIGFANLYTGGTLNLYAGTLDGSNAPRETGSDTTSSAMVVMFSSAVNDVRGACFFNMYGGTIIGRDAAAAEKNAGAVVMNGYNSVFSMYGGTITGGTALKGGAVYTTGKTYLNLLGGTITGNKSDGGAICTTNTASVLTIGKDMVVSGNTTLDGKNESNIYLISGEKLILDGTTTSADVGVTMESNGVFASNVTTDLTGAFHSDNPAYDVAYDAANKTLSVAEPAHRDHCICGGKAVGKGDHTSCSTITDWIAWGDSDTETTTLPSAAGNYYLVSDVNLAKVHYFPKNTTITICLNGHTVNGVSKKTVAFIDMGTVLNITDCGEGGKFVGTSTTYAGVFYMYEDSTLNLYAGKLDGSKAPPPSTGTSKYYTIVMFCDDRDDDGTKLPAFINMYGGQIVGRVDEECTKDVGAIYIGYSSSAFNMYGGSITGGAGKRGGAIIALNSVTLKLLGGTITGNRGPAGAIYASTKVKVTLGGDIRITGNTNTDGTAEINLSRPTGSNKIIIEKLKDALVGLSLTDTGIFAENVESDISDMFDADDSNLDVVYDEEAKTLVLQEAG